MIVQEALLYDSKGREFFLALYFYDIILNALSLEGEGWVEGVCYGS